MLALAGPANISNAPPYVMSSKEMSTAVAAGRLDLAFRFRYGSGDLTVLSQSRPFYYFAGTSGGLELSLRMDLPNSNAAVLRVRGVDELAAYIYPLQAVGGPPLYMAKPGDLVEGRAWFDPAGGARSMGIRLATNGALGYDMVGVASGSALGALSNAYFLGHPTYAIGGAGVFTGAVNPYGFVSQQPTASDPATIGIALGDSITEPSLEGAGVPSSIYGMDRMPGLLVCSLATGGAKVLDQLTAWQACPHRGQSYVRWVSIQVGVNDLVVGTATATIISRIQSIVADIAANNPNAVIILCALTPFRGYDATPFVSGAWSDVNTAIAGGGGSPIIGAHYRVTANATLDAGSGFLAAAYDYGDHLHTNTAGRTVNAAAIAAAVVASGNY